MKIYPYKPESESAKNLAAELNCKRIRHEGKPLRVNDFVVNWGSSGIKRELLGAKFINNPACVKVAGNKLSTFDMLHGHCTIPEYTTDKVIAQSWVDGGKLAVERHTLTGHSGEGIRIVGEGINDNVLQDAPLYVKYIHKTSEYRLHVTQKGVFFVQRKARNKDVPNNEVNWRVRNHENGFIYAHIDVAVPIKVQNAAITAVTRLGLDFGAVDIIHNVKNDTYYVLEVNTAPGLSGETLKQYVNIFKNWN